MLSSCDQHVSLCVFILSGICVCYPSMISKCLCVFCVLYDQVSVLSSSDQLVLLMFSDVSSRYLSACYPLVISRCPFEVVISYLCFPRVISKFPFVCFM